MPYPFISYFLLVFDFLSDPPFFLISDGCFIFTPLYTLVLYCRLSRHDETPRRYILTKHIPFFLSLKKKTVLWSCLES